MKPNTASKPHLIITFGIPGSGKSFFAEHFAETFKAPIVSHEKLQLINQSTDNDFAKLATEYMLGEIFKTGQTAVYDGPANTRSERINLTRLSRQAGYEPLLVWVQTDEITARKRATKTDDKHLVPLTDDQFDHAVKRFHQPTSIEKFVVISGKHNYASQLKIVLKNLATNSISSGQSDNSRISHFRRNVVLR